MCLYIRQFLKFIRKSFFNSNPDNARHRKREIFRKIYRFPVNGSFKSNSIKKKNLGIDSSKSVFSIASSFDANNETVRDAYTNPAFESDLNITSETINTSELMQKNYVYKLSPHALQAIAKHLNSKESLAEPNPNRQSLVSQPSNPFKVVLYQNLNL